MRNKVKPPRVLELARLVSNNDYTGFWEDVDWEDREALYERYKKDLQNCNKCILSLNRNHVVLPDGDTNASIMVVCEGPGFLEDLCIGKNSLVQTQRGKIPIQDLIPYKTHLNYSDKVLTDDGSWQNVLGVHYKGSKKVLEVFLSGTLVSLKATSDHKVFAKKRIGRSRKNKTDKIYYTEPIWIELSELKEGDYILSPAEFGDINSVIDVAEFINPRHKKGIVENYITPVTKQCYYSKTGKRSKKGDNFVEIIHPRSKSINRYVQIDENLGTFIGWYLAEGKVNFHKYGESECQPVGISFSLNNSDPIELIKDLGFKLFGVQGNITNESHSDQAKCLTFNSTILGEFFESLVGTGSKNKFIPTNFVNYNSNFKKGLLDSYLAGDGGYSCNYDLLSEIGLLCLSLGIPYHIRIFTEPKNRLINERVVKSGRQYQLRVSKDSGKFEWLPCKKFGSYIGRKIKKIVENDLTDVFDITVENNHNFYIADVGLVHNCGLPLVGHQELRGSHCAKCKKVTSCYDTRISWGKTRPLGVKRPITCKPEYVENSFLNSKYELYSAGSVIDGLLYSKYGTAFPRYNWTKFAKENYDIDMVSPWIFTNTVQCRSWDPELNRDVTPPNLAIKLCKFWVGLLYGIIQPKVLVLMGEVAKSAFFNKQTKLPYHTLLETKYGPTILTPHPAHTMRIRDSQHRQGLEYALIGKSLDTALYKAGLLDFSDDMVQGKVNGES